MRPDPLTPLQRLARSYGVLTKYRDGFRETREPSEESVVAVLRSLGAPISGLHEVESALAERRRASWARPLEPVIVSWLGTSTSFQLRLPQNLLGARVECTLELESGEAKSWALFVEASAVVREARVGGETYHLLRINCEIDVPVGYHNIHISVAGQSSSALLIRAPPSAPALENTWGVFLPLYALHTEQSLGAGDLSDLSRLIDWVHNLGGGLTGILPLLATFPESPSPYTPVSRLFWNEFYLDPRRLPEWSACPEARAYVDSAEVQATLSQSNQSRYVDFDASLAIKRKLIEMLAGALSGDRLQQYRQALEDSPSLQRYAEFRARVERESSGSSDSNGDAADYHAYAQWAIGRQLSDVAESSRKGGAGLYLDLPLGVHAQGFDRIENPKAFADGVTGGAPPDRFFSKGQNWGFVPLNPIELRESGHRYFIDCIRAQMQYAGVLRIDHVMGLHRQYWIPSGGDSDQGTYVQYPADELYAILCVEAQRHGTAIVGEDLGTVPPYLPSRMSDHGLQRMYVAQFELKPDAANALPPPPTNSLASINTHDTPTFASFWNGDDIRDQQALGLLETRHADEAVAHREKLKAAACKYFDQPQHAAPNKILEECLNEISASDSACVVVNIEDLWGESDPQNTPGTDHERPNWTRRAKHSFEKFSQDPDVLRILANVNRSRKSADFEQSNHD